MPVRLRGGAVPEMGMSPGVKRIVDHLDSLPDGEVIRKIDLARDLGFTTDRAISYHYQHPAVAARMTHVVGGVHRREAYFGNPRAIADLEVNGFGG